MAGTRAGGLKAAAKNKAKNPNFYTEIGKKSWKNPNRSRVTGFAANPELASIAGRKGGKKTKNDYKTTLREEEAVYDQEEVLAILAEAKADGSSPR